MKAFVCFVLNRFKSVLRHNSIPVEVVKSISVPPLYFSQKKMILCPFKGFEITVTEISYLQHLSV